MATKIDFDVDKVNEMMDAGMDYTQIAHEIGMSLSTLTSMLGTLARHRNARTERRQKMLALYKDGLQAKQIAHELGMNVNYVRSELKKMGGRKRRA